MKSLSLACLLAMATLVSGCGPSTRNHDTTAAEQLDKVKQDVKQTAKDMKDYTYAQKDEFVQKMQAELDALNQEFADLSAKVDRASDKAKAEAKPKMDALRAEITELKVDLDNAKAASATTWESVKTGTQKAMDKTKASLNDAGEWLKKQFNS